MEIKKLSFGISKSEAPAGTATEGADLSWFVITSGIVDRDMEVLDPNGMKVDNYLKNPVFLWGHDSSIPAIGKIEHLAKGADGKWRAGVRFADGTKYPFAGLIKHLHDDGILSAVSIRFIPKAWEDGNLDKDGFVRKYTDFEILETSSVNIPSNFEALQMRGKDGQDKAESKAAEYSEAFLKLFGGMIPGIPATVAAAVQPGDGPDADTNASANAGAKGGNELSKRNRATLRSIKSRLVDCEADIDSLLEKYAEEDGKDAPVDPVATLAEELKTFKSELMGELAGLKAKEPVTVPAPKTEEPGKDTQGDPGRREKTAAPVDTKVLLREIVAERAKYLSGLV